jgi:hypothetical protein
VLRGRKNNQNGVPLAVIAQAPPSAEDALAVLPQDLTVWSGDASALHDIRVHFAERATGLEKSPYQAAAIILQLLLGASTTESANSTTGSKVRDHN